MGRKAKPTSVKILDGSQNCRINKREPKPPTGELTCPKDFKGAAKDKWHELVSLLSPMGLATRADSDLIQLYCNTWALHVECESQVRQQGVVLEDGRRSPWMHEWHRTAEFLRKLSSELGLSATSRAKIEVPAVDVLNLARPRS